MKSFNFCFQLQVAALQGGGELGRRSLRVGVGRHRQGQGPSNCARHVIRLCLPRYPTQFEHSFLELNSVQVVGFGIELKLFDPSELPYSARIQTKKISVSGTLRKQSPSGVWIKHITETQSTLLASGGLPLSLDGIL